MNMSRLAASAEYRDAVTDWPVTAAARPCSTNLKYVLFEVTGSYHAFMH